MSGSDGPSFGDDFAQTVAMVLVLADVPVVVVAVVVGPLYGVALAAVIALTLLVGWFLSRRLDGGDSADDGSATDPVTELQRRYAAGELSEAEFERKLDRLVESEERAERAGVDTEELSLESE
jgi:uncharacterized membrane protein